MFQILLGLLLASACSRISADHLLGGTVSWRHLNSTGNSHVMEVKLRLGWTYHRYPCNDHMINTRAHFSASNWGLTGQALSSDFPYTISPICSAYSVEENWSYGYNSFEAVVNGSGPFQIGFSACCWPNTHPLEHGNSDSSTISTEIDFGLRSDTGKVNNPPVTFNPPVVKLIHGCMSTIRIVSLDTDGDRITCRYAIGSECDGLCGSYPHFTLNEEDCTIDYDGGGGKYFIAVALMLEDHPSRTITLGGSRTIYTNDAISATPLQFAINIVNPTTSLCNGVPSYPTDNINEGTNFTIPRNGAFNEIIRARPGQSGGSIDRFIILGPTGMTVEVITYEGNGIFATNLTWSPDDSQLGYHDVCFYAVDGNDNNGEYRCFTVTVTDNTFDPCELVNGGCSDVCTSIGSSHICSCPDPCWELSSNRKTCSPKMMVECTGKTVNIAVPNCSTNRTVVAGTSVEYFSIKSCQSTPSGSDHYLSFGSQECGLKMEVSPVSVEYDISIWTWKESTSSAVSAVITRGEWAKVPVICSLPTNLILNGSFVPVLPLNTDFFPEDVSIDGMGSFSLHFEYYKNKEYTVVYGPSEYPVKVKVNDKIFISIGAAGRPGLQFFTEQCVAKTSRVATLSTVVYTFISNGCLLDSTVTRHSTPSSMENRFSILAFEFENKLLGNRGDSDIFLECQVILCNSTRTDTRCASGCTSPAGRRRRDIGNETEEERTADDDNQFPPLREAESLPQTVSSRFVFVFDEAEEEPPKEASITNWILIGVGVVILSIAIFLSFYVVKHLRRKSTPPTKLSGI